MIRIALIDDQEIWLQKLEKDLEEILLSLGKEGKIQSMTKATTLLEEYQDGYYFDLLFIDIQMKDLDGIQLGEKIRSLGDNRVKMVYVSAFPDLAYKAINNEVIGFIDKASYCKEDVELVLKRALKKLEKTPEYYEFFQNRQKRSIDQEKILYFFKEGRKVGIQTVSPEGYQILWISRDLKTATQGLGDRFLQIRQDIVIQRFYAKDLGNYRVKMQDGKVFTVGRSYQKDYWGVSK